MAVINLNDTTPPAPAGKANIKWQADSGSPRNVSAYVDTLPGTTHVSEEPAGALNGSNTVFTLSFTPVAASLILALNGVAQNPGSGSPLTGADYAISGPTITYAVAPRATDSHNAWYTH
jgi:hypothetical protein